MYKKGDVIQRFEYAAYGRESFVLNPNLAWDPAFTGQQYDIETGLYYYRARYYNPILGRFIQPDTIVQNSLDPQSWNRYSYVRNNPLKYVDPSGNIIASDIEAMDSDQYAEFMDSIDSMSTQELITTRDEILASLRGDSDDNNNANIGEITVWGDDPKDAGNGPAPANAGDGHRDGGAGSVREEGGLVGASISQAGSAVTSSGSGGMSLSGALSIARTVNDVVGLIGLGALMVAPPIGSAILTGTLIAGVAIDTADFAFGNMTGSEFKVSLLSTVAGKYVGGSIASKLGIKYGFHGSISRYFSKASGRFVPASAGRSGNFIEKIIGKGVKATTKWGLESLGDK